MKRELTPEELIFGGAAAYGMSKVIIFLPGYQGKGFAAIFELLAIIMMVIGAMRFHTHKKAKKLPRDFWGIFKKTKK